LRAAIDWLTSKEGKYFIFEIVNRRRKSSRVYL